MDIDARVAARARQWERLEELTNRRRLSGAEVDEFVRLYQQTAADLSAIRTHAPELVVVNYLSNLINRARGKTTGGREFDASALSRFFLYALPAAFYRIRYLTVAVMVAFIALATFYGMWIYHTPGGLDSIASPQLRESYANVAFESYYSDLSAPDFTQVVWVNNAYIAAQAVALGVTGIFPIFTVVQNAVGLGEAGAMMAEAERLDIFFYLILPHGQLELTAIFVAVAAGLRIFWAWIAPGALPRSQSLAQEGRSLMTVALGLVVVLGISGIVEGFVPRSSLPVVIKILIGTATLVGYWAYTLILGKRAVEQGETGDLLDEEKGAERVWSL